MTLQRLRRSATEDAPEYPRISVVLEGELDLRKRSNLSARVPPHYLRDVSNSTDITDATPISFLMNSLQANGYPNAHLNREQIFGFVFLISLSRTDLRQHLVRGRPDGVG